MTEWNGTIVLPDRLIRYGKVTCENGRIVRIEEIRQNIPEHPMLILPGLVDIHNHGAMCCDYMDATEDSFATIGKYLASRGITSAQCTTVSAPTEQIKTLLEFYRNRCNIRHPGECRFIGVHIEGPYIAPASRGAHLLETLRTPEDGYDWVLENADIIREITVAPELPQMPAMIRALRRKGIVVSGGHDQAELEDVQQAADSGMTHSTHLYCAMSTLHKTGGHRRCGLTEYVMTHDNVTAEIIADNHHVPPLLAKMVYNAKGPKGVCVVSDAIAPSGLPERPDVYRLGTGEDCTKVIVENGVAMVEDRSCYAGSVASLDRMIRNLVLDAGIPLVDAVRMASLTPAEVVGAQESIGSIEAGKYADLCIMDQTLHVRATVIQGELVYKDKEWKL